MAWSRLRAGLALYLSMMVAYGLANMANDFWLEQVVKRGWTRWAIPGVIRPSVTWMWAVIIVVGVGLFLTALKPDPDRASTRG